MKRFFDIKYNGAPYDAVGRRKGQDLFYILGGNKVAPGGASAGPTAMNKAPTKIATTAKVPASSTGAPKTSGITPKGHSMPSTAAKGKIESGDTAKLQNEISELRMNMDTVEKERDFYFAKLRDIELYLQANTTKATPFTENILKILYAAEEEKITIDEAGNLSITQGSGSGAGTGAGTGTGDQQMLFDDNLAAADDEMADTAEEGKNN
jgi:RP/EB family microtubule-associated protein